jgi:Zn-dependent M28 family amino/carboxypeptidase
MSIRRFGFRPACLLLALALAAGSFTPRLLAGETNTTPASADSLAALASTYRQHIMTLADPWFEGRCPGDRGNADAADYLEFHFKRMGLSPAFAEGDKPFTTYHQYFVPGRLRGGKIVAQKESMTLVLPSGERPLVAGTDMRALALSGSGKAEGKVVFVGYAIKEGNDGYASFQGGVDLKGRIALVLRFEPMKDDGTSKWAEDRWSPKADLPQKIRECFERGAAGVVVVNPPGADDERIGRLMNFTEAMGSGRDAFTGPVMMLGNDAAANFVTNADQMGRSLLDLRKHADASGEMIELPNAAMTIEATIAKEEHKTSNVAGVLHGKGPLADEWIVIGGHYDHVGYGDFGSIDNARGVIHPGADDNASGTAGVLTVAAELAKTYKNLPADANRRSILVMGFSAEESGLEGSRHYTRNAIAPVEKHYLMINMDMIGRLRDEPPLEISGLGTAAGLAEWLDPYWKNAGFAIRPLTKRSQFDGRSDHASFHQVKIPAIFFFTGLHEDYHRPADTADKINIEGGAKIADLVTRIALDASTRLEGLPFGAKREEEKPTEPQAATPAAEPAPAAPAATGGMGRVRFGIMPGDYADEKPGVLVGEIRPGTPAEKAGLAKGDRLLKWNDVVLKDVEAFTAQMRAANPGDKITITYERDGKEATAEVVLVERTAPAGG